MPSDYSSVFFSVEGETEKWYLDWLEDQINAAPEAKYKVKIKADVQPDPVSYGKKLTVQSKSLSGTFLTLRAAAENKSRVLSLPSVALRM